MSKTRNITNSCRQDKITKASSMTIAFFQIKYSKAVEKSLILSRFTVCEVDCVSKLFKGIDTIIKQNLIHSVKKKRDTNSSSFNDLSPKQQQQQQKTIF